MIDKEEELVFEGHKDFGQNVSQLQSQTSKVKSRLIIHDEDDEVENYNLIVGNKIHSKTLDRQEDKDKESEKSYNLPQTIDRETDSPSKIIVTDPQQLAIVELPRVDSRTNSSKRFDMLNQQQIKKGLFVEEDLTHTYHRAPQLTKDKANLMPTGKIMPMGFATIEGEESSIIQKRKSNIRKLPPMQHTNESIEIIKQKAPLPPLIQQRDDKDDKDEMDDKIDRLFLEKVRKIRSQEITNLKSFNSNPLPKNTYMECSLQRNRSNCLYPQYDIYLVDNLKYLISGKKESCSFTSKYRLFSDQDRFDSKDDFIGFCQGNFLGTVFNVFSEGKAPSGDQPQHQQREVIATISYGGETSNKSGARNVKVYILKEGYNYFDLEGIVVNKEIDLKTLYENGSNVNRIKKFTNKEPIWDKKRNFYALNFHGKMRMASVKNMILVDEDAKEVCLLAKVEQDLFHFDIHHPFSPRIAMGLIVSSFDFKFASQ